MTTQVSAPAATRLSYVLTPAIVECSHEVTLLIVLDNASEGPVACARLGFALPVGTDAGDLTAAPETIAVSSSAEGWAVESTGDGTFAATPLGESPLAPHANVAFTFEGVAVNAVTGLAEIEVVEEADRVRRTDLGLIKMASGPLADLAEHGLRSSALVASPPSPALLSYTASPAYVPYSGNASHPTKVSLMIAVNNATGQNQDCRRIAFVVPVGTGAGALTSDPGSITASAATGTAWGISGDGAGTFTAVPKSGAETIDAGGSIAFLLAGVPVNALAGLAEITVCEGVVPMRRTQIAVSKVPPGLAITQFSADPIQVVPPQTSTLDWTTTGADSCFLSSGGGSTSVPVSGSQPVPVNQTTVFTLSANGGGTSTQAQLTVVVPELRILSFSAAPVQVPQGGPSTLSWNVVNADSCYIEPGHISVSATSGTLAVTSSATEAYILVAAGLGTSVSASVVVDVMPVAIGSFTASPTAITIGQSAAVQWATTWSTGTAIDQAVGTVQPSGAVTVTPENTTTYTLTAQGYNGPVTARTQVQVASVAITAFTVSPVQIQPGGSATLSWSTEWASACDINGQSVPVNGTLSVSPSQATSYTLTAQGPNGPATAQVRLHLNAVDISSFGADCPVGGLQCFRPYAQWELYWSTWLATSVALLYVERDQVLSTEASGKFSSDLTCLNYTPATFRLMASGPGGLVSQQLVLVYND